MADSISNTISIYRLTNTGDTEVNIVNDEAVGMNDGAGGTSLLYVVGYNWDGLSRRTNVPSPSSNALTNPDVKLQGLTLVILIKVNETITHPNRKTGILTRSEERRVG